MRKRLSIMLAIILVLPVMLVGCGGKKDDNTFVVGMEAAYAPFNWTQIDDSNGAVQISGNKEYAGGYDVEMAKLIAEGLGKELVIKKIEWDGLLPALTSGSIDAIIAGISPTPEREETIDFSDSYYHSNLAMIVRKDGEYTDAKSIQDFSGARITGQLNTFHYTVIDQIDGVIQETAMPDFPSMRVALESGIIDGYVSEKPEGMSVEAATDNFMMIEFEDGFEASEKDSSIAVGVKKGSELKEEINKVLETIDEETRQEIMKKVVETQPSNQ